MERKIGEIFEHNGDWYQVVECSEDNYPCIGCCGCKGVGGARINGGECYGDARNDRKFVIFKKLEKVGEPYSYYFPTGRIIYFQRYKCYQNPIIEGDIIWHWVDLTWVGIEIKQNKENNMEEKKLNLKPFDIQKAREGKPVCTRDGHKARIICFDYAGETGDYPIVALVSYNKGNNCHERILKYTSDGLFNKYRDYEHDDDLMMLPERKEGWVNIYRDCEGMNITRDDNIYSSKEAAIASAQIIDGNNYIATSKVEWEEQP